MPVPFTDCKFEAHAIPEMNLKGQIEAEVTEVGGIDPISIIHTSQSWKVTVNWSVEGLLAPLLCGVWHVTVFLETLGPGEEYEFGPRRLPFKVCEDNGEYSLEFEIGPGRVDPGPNKGDTKIYLLGVTVVGFDDCGNPAGLVGRCRGADITVTRD